MILARPSSSLHIIKNRKSLLLGENRKDRKIILDCLEAGIESVLPDRLIERELELKISPRSRILSVKSTNQRYDLYSFDKIIVIGGGKASGYLAEGLERVLGPKQISAGYVNILRGTRGKFHTKKIVLNEASHPVPDKSGVKGAMKMVELLRQEADQSTLLICLFSGGASSIVPLPAEGITLRDKIETTNLLLRSGADIDRMNCIRKHISAIKGGQLVKKANGATVLSLIISDVVGDHLEAISSGPTAPDPTTFADAARALSDLKIMDKVPVHVRDRIKAGVRGLIAETPKPGDPIFSKVSNVIIASNAIACERIKTELHNKLGHGARIGYLGSEIVGEASLVAKELVSKSLSVSKDDFEEFGSSSTSSSSPNEKRGRGRKDKEMKQQVSALVWGGETPVTVRGKGIGGRNQEAALSALESIGEISTSGNNVSSITMAFFATDGIDGRTKAAGALIDVGTFLRAKKKGLDIKNFLEQNDSNTFFRKVGSSLIVTGATGTNVNDVGISITRHSRK